MRNRELTPEQIDVLRRCKYELAHLLQRRRKTLGVSQQEVSRRAQLEYKTIGRIERGEVTPTFETLILLTGAIALSPAQFFHKIADALAGIEAQEGRQCIGRHRIEGSSFVVEIWQEGRDK